MARTFVPDYYVRVTCPSSNFAGHVGVGRPDVHPNIVFSRITIKNMTTSHPPLLELSLVT